jgi:hypothetical protein
MDQSDNRPNLRPTTIRFSTKASKAERLQEDMLTFHNIDAEKELTALLRAAVQEEIKKEEALNPPSLEERISKMKKMLESTLPTVLQEAIHKNILSLMEKKIRRDHCE